MIECCPTSRRRRVHVWASLLGAMLLGGVIGLFRDGAQHLLDPLALDRMKAAHRDDGK